ncbi:MAG: metallophosphoesterase [Candidatus Pacearchaeota archaeon]|jgi:Icc-related predicted phosphoesterase
MKILALGDLHGKFPQKIKKISKDIDLILLTGDLGKADLMRKMAFQNIKRQKKGLEEIEYNSIQKKKAYMEAYNSTIKIISQLAKISPVFLVYGNVESTNSETKQMIREIKLNLPVLSTKLSKIKNVKVINNKLVNFKGIKIAGIKYFIDESWVKEFKPEEYKESLKEARKESQKVSKILNKFNQVDILLTHQPPYKILDRVGKGAPKHWQGKHAGSRTILNYIKKRQPKYVICGHIHEADGTKKLDKTTIHNLGLREFKIINL